MLPFTTYSTDFNDRRKIMVNRISLIISLSLICIMVLLITFILTDIASSSMCVKQKPVKSDIIIKPVEERVNYIKVSKQYKLTKVSKDVVRVNEDTTIESNFKDNEQSAILNTFMKSGHSPSI